MTEYHGLQLKSKRYSFYPPLSKIRDDGLIDKVAIRRALDGDPKVRLTPREVVCAVWDGNQAGLQDQEIAARLHTERVTVQKLRDRAGIPTLPRKFSEDKLWQLFSNKTERAKASPARLAAAGIVTREAA